MNRFEWKDIKTLCYDLCLRHLIENEIITKEMSYTEAHRIAMKEYDKKYMYREES